jgi:hypothetical protein
MRTPFAHAKSSPSLGPVIAATKKLWRQYHLTAVPALMSDPRHVPSAALGLHRGERLTYVYNFTDHWVCDLRLEAIVPLDPRRSYPVCTGGKRATPPEDCGGVWAYMQMVDRHHVPLQAMAAVATVLNRLLEVG